MLNLNGEFRDSRLRVAGRISGAGTSAAVAVWLEVMDCAAGGIGSGALNGVVIDDIYDLPEGTCSRVMDALAEVGLIAFSEDGEVLHPSTPPATDAPRKTAATSGGRETGNAARCRRYRERRKALADRGSTTADTPATCPRHARDMVRHGGNMVQHGATCSQHGFDMVQHAPRARAVSTGYYINTKKEEIIPPVEESVDLEIAGVLDASCSGGLEPAHASVPCIAEPAHASVPCPIDAGDITLEQIWDAYPEQWRGSWKDAEREWHFVKRDRSVRRKGLWDVLAGIEAWRESDQWRRRYIPTLGNFLRKHAWLVTPPPAPVRSEHERRTEAFRTFDQAAQAGALEYSQEELDAYDAMLREREQQRRISC